MGCGAVKSAREAEKPVPSSRPSLAKRRRSSKRCFTPIPDRYTTLAEVTKGIREAGLESSNLIIGVDFTKSNLWTGSESFGGA